MGRENIVSRLMGTKENEFEVLEHLIPAGK